MTVKRVTIRSAAFPDRYLRLDGTGVTKLTDAGSGTVDCQNFAGPMETLVIETFPENDREFAIRSTYFDKVYLRMDASAFNQASSSGGGVVNCQYTASSWEKFKFIPQPDGSKAIASTKWPGVYLRMDGSIGSHPGGGLGAVNCQMSLGPWEKFIVTELETLNGLTRAELEEAITKYGPILQLHKDEIYENCSVEWFLERSSLYDSKTNTTIVHPTAAQLPQAAAEEKRYWFTLEDRGKSGDLSTAKAYVRAYWNQGMTYTDLQFWFFSAYNGPGTAKVNGLLMDTIAHTGTANMAPMGEHVGDWEYCVIRVDNKGKHILKVILSQHGDAVTIEGKDLYKSFEMIDGTHPVIYSSRNGHAIYPSAGPNYTHYEKQPKGGIPAGIEFWLRNDTVKGGKSLESSKKYQVISADWLEGAEAISQPAWVNYRYRWGPEGTVTHMTSESVKEILSAALGWLSTLLPFIVTVSVAILPQFKKDDINGPGAPIIQGAWNGNY